MIGALNRARLATNVAALSAGGGEVGLPTFAYQAETEALASLFSVAPTAQRKYTYDMAIRRLKDDGLWSALHGLWTAGANATDSRRNIIAPGTYDLVPVGTPNFTANDGWIASSVTADSINTGIPISVLNAESACIGFTCPTTTEAGSDNTDMGVVDGTGGILIRCKDSSGNRPRGRAFSADTSLATTTFTQSYGFHAIARTTSSVIKSHHSGVDSANITATTVATTDATKTIHLLKANGAGSGSGRKTRTAFVAKRALTEAELRKLHAIVLEMETAIAYGDPQFSDAGYAPEVVAADVVVYGATAIGICAAYAAKRANPALRVVIVGGWRDTTLGGMSAGGLGFADFDNAAALWGLPSFIIARLKVLRNFANGTSMIFEPRTFEWVCRELLDPSRPNGLDIPVYWSEGASSGSKTGARLASITTRDGRTFTGAQFIDATYEGDLLPIGGVDFIVGREAAGTGIETLNGFRNVDLLPSAGSIRHPDTNVALNIDPYVTPGVPSSGRLPGVYVKPDLAAGAADGRNQAFNFRLAFTATASRRIPFDTTPPPDYDKAKYEILLRQFEQVPTMTFLQVFKADLLLNGVTDTNNATYGISTDDIESAQAFIAAATNAGREAAWKGVENYINGLIWLLCYDPDPRIPSGLRTTLLTYGWDAYNHVARGRPGDANFFPKALYVREFRRMRSDMIWNGNDLSATDGTAPRSTKTVALASYAMDSHNTMRFVDESTGTPRVINEGGLFISSSGGADKISPLPLDIYIPKKAECENLSSLFAASLTHIAFGAVRMEFTAMEAGHSLGIVAAKAIETGQALQDLDYSTLRTAILSSATLTGEVAPSLPQVN